MTAIEELCGRIKSNHRFAADYSSLLASDLSTQLLLPEAFRLDEEVIQRLVQSAAIFSQSPSADTRQMAYRIVVASLAYQEALNGTRNVAKLILTRLGNYPAIRFAFAGEDSDRRIPQTTFFEMLERENSSRVNIAGREALLTDLQLTVWNLLTDRRSVALSAPTSAGKSFVLQSYIRDAKRKNPSSNIVYLVPSRALINQVSAALSSRDADFSLLVATVPVEINSGEMLSPTYVFTPERLQVLLQSSPNLVFHTAIVDEAHLIGDGARGVILYSMLQEMKRRNPEIQFLFSSPQIRDPSVFGKVVGRDDVHVVKTTDSPVAQNLILVRGRAERPREVKLSLWRGAEESSLGHLDVDIDLLSSDDRLIYLSWYLGRNSQSLVYASGPASCESIANKIAILSTQEGAEVDQVKAAARSALSEFAVESVHKSFLLAETVHRGVAFHYGRIPTLLRRAIEDEFDRGNLDCIVCTSTLLQGVNLPARNIFLHNPQTGSDRPIESVDFWNLAGRAGRLGRDFQGNVFLVDYESWESKPLNGERDQSVKPAFEVVLTDQLEEFLQYVSSADRPSGDALEFEVVFAQLFREYRKGRLEEALAGIGAIAPDLSDRLTAAFKLANETVQVATATLDESPQVSGFRQQDLYEYMVKRIGSRGPDYLIPLHPNAGFKEGLDKLRPVFARVHKYLELNSNNSHRYWAPLALRWMRGEPLPLLIDGAIAYYKTRAPATVIREVLSNVENDLRFRYVKLLGCYISVLKRALEETGHVKFADRVPALPLYLELGAASKTMISLLGLGLSRQSSWKVASLTLNREMDAASALAFVRSLNLERVGLSPYLTSEVRQVIAERS